MKSAIILRFAKLVYAISIPPDAAHILLHLSPSSSAILTSLAPFSLLPLDPSVYAFLGWNTFALEAAFLTTVLQIIVVPVFPSSLTTESFFRICERTYILCHSFRDMVLQKLVHGL